MTEAFVSIKIYIVTFLVDNLQQHKIFFSSLELSNKDASSSPSSCRCFPYRDKPPVLYVETRDGNKFSVESLPVPRVKTIPLVFKVIGAPSRQKKKKKKSPSRETSPPLPRLSSFPHPNTPPLPRRPCRVTASESSTGLLQKCGKMCLRDSKLREIFSGDHIIFLHHCFQNFVLYASDVLF